MARHLVFSFLLFAGFIDAPQEFYYSFADPEDLEHFVVLQGRWSVYSQTLVCNSDGSRDEIRWRRAIRPGSSIATSIGSAESCGILLADPAHSWLFLVDKTAGELRITENDAPRKVAYFDWPLSKPITLGITVETSSLKIDIGESSLELPIDHHEHDWSLSLINNSPRCRFLDLKITRPEDADDTEAESREIALSLAQQAFDHGDWQRALSLLQGQKPIPELEPESLLTLNRWTMTEPRIRRVPAIEAYVQQRTLESTDGEIRMTLPFRGTWSGESPMLRRTEGTMLRMACGVPWAQVEVFRYDARIDYTFGQEPKIAFLPGGNFESIAAARFADLKVELPEARELEALTEDRGLLPGQNASRYSLSYASDAGRKVISEVFLRHRGNTVRITAECLESDLRVLTEELHWLRQTVEFPAP